MAFIHCDGHCTLQKALHLWWMWHTPLADVHCNGHHAQYEYCLASRNEVSQTRGGSKNPPASLFLRTTFFRLSWRRFHAADIPCAPCRMPAECGDFPLQGHLLIPKSAQKRSLGREHRQLQRPSRDGCPCWAIGTGLSNRGFLQLLLSSCKLVIYGRRMKPHFGVIALPLLTITRALTVALGSWPWSGFLADSVAF